MKLTPAQLGAARALGAILLTTVLTWLANSANLTGVVPPMVSAIIAALAASAEAHVADSKSTAFFGAVRKA